VNPLGNIGFSDVSRREIRREEKPAAVRMRSLQELAEETEEMRRGIDSHKKAQKRAKGGLSVRAS